MSKHSIISLDDVGEIKFLNFGITELDKVASLPIGQLTTVFGASATGKTDLALKVAINASKNKLKVLFCDVENRLNVRRVEALGGDKKLIDYSNAFIQEEVAELIIKNIENYNLIIVDSIAQLLPRAEKEGEVGDANIGLRAKLNWKWIRMVQGTLARSNCALLLISQLRQSPNMFNPTYIAGGDNLMYNSSLVIQLSSNNSSDKIVKNGELIGRKVTAVVKKSNLGFVENNSKKLFLGQEASFKLLF